jgi:hypothetical protein
MFDFSDLLAEYSFPIQVIMPETGAKGTYSKQTGEWEASPTADPIDTTGAVIPYSSNEVYQSGGRLTKFDTQLLIDLYIPPKSIIIYNNQKYSVEQVIPYDDYAGFNQYELKWVSAFD